MLANSHYNSTFVLVGVPDYLLFGYILHTMLNTSKMHIPPTPMPVYFLTQTKYKILMITNNNYKLYLLSSFKGHKGILNTLCINTKIVQNQSKMLN